MSESGSRRQSREPARRQRGGETSRDERRPGEPSRERRDTEDVVSQLKQLKDGAADVVAKMRDGAGSAAEQVKQKAADMKRAITTTVKDEAERLFDEQKGKAASKVARYGKVIHQAAHALHAVKADGLAEVVDGAAEQVEGITDYLEERNLAQVLQDAGDVAERHPALMLGGMFLTGFALARFLKASESHQEEGAGGEAESGEEDESSERPSGSGSSGRGGSRR